MGVEPGKLIRSRRAMFSKMMVHRLPVFPPAVERSSSELQPSADPMWPSEAKLVTIWVILRVDGRHVGVGGTGS